MTQTSHVGGHKFAGVVVIYRKFFDLKTRRLEVQGIWLGRIEPRHVPLIVEHTVAHGRVWPELLRGGIWHKHKNERKASTTV